MKNIRIETLITLFPFGIPIIENLFVWTYGKSFPFDHRADPSKDKYSDKIIDIFFFKKYRCFPVF